MVWTTGIVFWLTFVFHVAVCQGGDPAHIQADSDTCVAPQLPDHGPYSILEGQSLSFSFRVRDPDPNAELVYQVTKKPKGANVNGTLFSWTPEHGAEGTYWPRFRVCDKSCSPMQCDTKKVRIDVGYNECRAPVLDPIGNFEFTIGETLEFQVSAHDPDTDQSNLDFIFGPLTVPRTAFDPETQIFSWTPVLIGDYVDTHESEFIVCDDCPTEPLCDRETVMITVKTTPEHFIGNWINEWADSDNLFHGMAITSVGTCDKWLYVRLYGDCLSDECEVAKGYAKFEGKSVFRTKLYEDWGEIYTDLAFTNDGTFIQGKIEVNYKDDGQEDEVYSFWGARVDSFSEP
jgi:hypothetical protein